MVLRKRTRGRPAVNLASFFADISLVEVREVIDFIYNAVEVAEGLLSSSAPLLTTVFQNILKICIVGSDYSNLTTSLAHPPHQDSSRFVRC